MRVVIALGGNALLRRGQPPEADTQQANVREAVAAVAAVAREHDVILTHGNGPLVGVLALQSEQDPALQRPYPLDAVVAETAGAIGYWLQRELARELPGRAVVSVLTQTVVDPADHSFRDPTKFVGQVYDEPSAHEVARAHGWTVKPDGRWWRRVVASPPPLDFVELPVLRTLVDAGVLVVCAGGGGVPVARTADGLTGVEAVVDKDRAAALLGRGLGAEALLMLTDVAAVQAGYGTPSARELRRVSSEELRAMSFPAGSMGPKVEAACRFVDTGGRLAAIGRLEDAPALLAGATGTTVYRDA